MVAGQETVYKGMHLRAIDPRQARKGIVSRSLPDRIGTLSQGHPFRRGNELHLLLSRQDRLGQEVLCGLEEQALAPAVPDLVRGRERKAELHQVMVQIRKSGLD